MMNVIDSQTEVNLSTSTATAETYLQFLLFLIEGKKFAIDLDDVREINRVQACMSVERGFDWIEGLINLRGSVVTMINLRKRLGIPENSHLAERYQIILEESCSAYFASLQPTKQGKEGQSQQRERLGLIVDSIGSILNVSDKHLSPLTGTSGYAAKEQYQECIKGVIKVERQLISIIDIGKIIQDHAKGVK
ncbi:MAG: chemotaxis protein CheW [Vampirovibrionales bacterium]